MRTLKIVTLSVVLLTQMGCSSDQAAGCASEQKSCAGTCVARAPENGCDDLTCSACSLANASATCSAGKCAVQVCASGFGDCDGVASTGCETVLASSAQHCGACGNACASGVCESGRCLGDDEVAVRTLRATRGGFCADVHPKLVTLCVDSIDGVEEYCKDATIMRPYPNGLSLTVGFHWDGQESGTIVKAGGDNEGKIIGLDFDKGELFASGPAPAAPLAVRLTRGTHVVTYRVGLTEHALFVDGIKVATGPGTSGVVPVLLDTHGPGFVLGHRMSYWWETTAANPGRWLRMAPFFVHLRDGTGEALATFRASEELRPSDKSVVFMDPDGARGTEWTQKVGPQPGRARNGSKWVDDVWSGCLTPP